MTDNRQISPNNVKTSVKHAMQRKRPCFIWGPPGIGKSDIIGQIGEEWDNTKVIDVRLSLWEPTDIKGIPYFDSNLGQMCWAPPAELPDENMASKYDNIILFLDEMNSAAPAVQAAAYQLILNRKVGTYELPDNVYIVAAGNRDSDKGVTYRMPSPLANRFIHFEMTVAFDDWFEWAVTKGNIHRDVVAYLQSNKQELYDFDPKSSSRSFPTPRSWSFVSELLDDNLDESTLYNLISGAVGEGIVHKFMNHRKIAEDLPKPEDVLSGKVTELKTKEISAKYALIISLCYEMKESKDREDDDFNKKADYFLRFSMDNFDTELVIMGFKLAISQYQLPLTPDDLENFDEFHNRYGSYIHAAQ